MSKTAGQLKSEIRSLIWADQEPENLIAQHDEHFQEALAYIAENVPCEQEGNIDIIDFCKTFSKCGCTVVPEPNGIVRRVFTLVKEAQDPNNLTGPITEDWCDPVYYDEVDFPMPEYFGKYCMARMKTLPSFPSTLDLGFHPSDPSQDSPAGRARRGIFCKHGKNIIVAPWIQSVERLCIEYDGPKIRWGDDDPVSDDQLYRKAVMLYWHYLHEFWFGDRKAAGEIHDVSMQSGRGTFDRALGDILYRCENRRKVRQIKHNPYYQWRCLLNPVIEVTGQPLTPVGPEVIAHIGNFVDGNTDLVAALIARHSIAAIVAAGTNVTPDLGLEYDQLIGHNYQAYIKPYYGDFGAGAADKNRFWPAIGTPDWIDGLQQFHSFFATPKNRNYYEVCLGPVHLFVLDIAGNEPDGNTQDSAQGQWLKAKLALSPAPWKVVLAASFPNPAWPFKAWGADMVLTGSPYYARQSVAGLTIVNNGAGGGPQQAPPSGNAFASSSNNGAGFITATRCSLVYQFLDVNDILIDEVALHKDSTCVDPASAQASTLTGGASDVAPVVCKARIYKNAGNPNGIITPETPEKCFCLDTVNNVIWVKDDGQVSNQGWA